MAFFFVPPRAVSTEASVRARGRRGIPAGRKWRVRPVEQRRYGVANGRRAVRSPARLFAVSTQQEPVKRNAPTSKSPQELSFAREGPPVQ